MRRGLALTVLAVTAMVSVAFLVPLAAVVQVVARNRALSAAEQESRALAGVVAAIGTQGEIRTVLDQLNTGNPRQAAVVLADGSTMGAPVPVPPSELALVRSGRAFTASSAGSRRLWVPVRDRDGSVAAAVVAVPAGQLTEGVRAAWTVLFGVGVALVLLGVVLANRLARPMVVSVEELGSITARLQGGDLGARVVPSGPPEVVKVGRAVNQLADRVDELLAVEREAAADISHRLRTPLMVLQLEADGLRSMRERRRMSAAVRDLTEAVTTVIQEARQGRAPRPAVPADLGAVVAERLAFWSVLADDQGRPWSKVEPDGPLPVTVPNEELAAAVDALLANVFGHTPEGTGLRVSASRQDGGAVLTVDDDGPGFPRGAVPIRGRSSAGSTGLGLDIVRRTAERAGGGLSVDRSPSGGARITVRLGPIVD